MEEVVYLTSDFDLWMMKTARAIFDGTHAPRKLQQPIVWEDGDFINITDEEAEIYKKLIQKVVPFTAVEMFEYYRAVKEIICPHVDAYMLGPLATLENGDKLTSMSRKVGDAKTHGSLEAIGEALSELQSQGRRVYLYMVVPKGNYDDDGKFYRQFLVRYATYPRSDAEPEEKVIAPQTNFL